MDLKMHYTPLVMTGYMILDLPEEIFSNLKHQAFELLQNNFSNGEAINKNLYGAIEREYYLKDRTLLEKFLYFILPHYDNFIYQKQKQYRVDHTWINYQKKYEMNPIHTHTECDLSFVVWIKIPYSLENEKNHKSVKNSNDFHYETTAFSFLFPASDNKAIDKHILQIDSRHEGKMILFPASLNHIVYPFYTSDDYRISIAGNIKIIDND